MRALVLSPPAVRANEPSIAAMRRRPAESQPSESSGRRVSTRQLFLGDYTRLTAYDNRVYGVWTEGAQGKAIETDSRKPDWPFTVVLAGPAGFTALVAPSP